MKPRGRRPIKNLPVGIAPACACGCGQVSAWNRRKNRWNVYVVGHYRRPALYKDREWMDIHYTKGNECAASIAKMFGVNHTTIFKSIDRLGIERKTLSEVHIGKGKAEKNGAWVGGTTPERQKFCRLPAWKTFVQQIFERDGFQCVKCGATHDRGRGLHCHHIMSWAKHPELRLDGRNCITLCNRCHPWVHSRGNVQQMYLASAV